jgi:serine/threonine protein kinase
MSPEYALDGHFSVKSDVFSFGVMVLEIISGKRNTGFYQVEHELSLLGYVSISSFPTISRYSMRNVIAWHILFFFVK